jgi:Ca-activated chloride channel family protein
MAAGITLIAVGLGSAEGGAVPLDGEPVISFLRSDILKDAAERTGGRYIDGNRSSAAALLADHLASLAAPGSAASGTALRGFRREKEPLGYIFVIAALVFMGVSKIMEKGRRKHG